MKVKVISFPFIFQVLYVLCFTNVKISGERLQDQLSSGIYYFSRVANHVTSDDRVHGISENKLLNSGNIFLDIFVNTCQN